MFVSNLFERIKNLKNKALMSTTIFLADSVMLRKPETNISL